MNSDIENYYPSPFWFLNHKLEKNEIVRQLNLMKEQHINSFFMHPRAGLLTTYGSDEWFEMIRFIVDEADKLNMSAYLYDEDPYPSGAAGGRILMEHPEFAAREMIFNRFSPDENQQIHANLGTGKLLEAKLVETDQFDNILHETDCFNQVGVLREDFYRANWDSTYYAQIFGKIKYPHYRAETFHPHLQINLDHVKANQKLFVVTLNTVVTDSKYGKLADNLNPKCVKEFIRLTHDRYKEVLDSRLGNSVKGIFTDETPCCNGNLPWNDTFNEFFIKQNGYAMNGNFSRIFVGNSPEVLKIRLDYFRTLSELFIESFYRPVNNWCKKNHLKLTGHGIGEEDPCCFGNGGNMFAIQSYVGIPGFDHITYNIPDGKGFTSLNLGGKLVSSAASQNGIKIVQSESMGCNPYNLTTDGMFKIAHWLYVLGINWLVPHGFHYSYDGFRKDDAGKSFFFQDQNYPEFHKFADYFARLGYKLGNAKNSAKVCVLHPVSSFQQYLPTYHEQSTALRDQYYHNIQTLFSAQIPFEMADENAVFSAKIHPDGKFSIKHQIYQTLVLPFADLTSNVKTQLIKLRDSGVEIIDISEIATLSARNNFIFTSELDSGLFMTLEKENAGQKLLYLFNNQDKSGFIKIKSKYCFAALYSPQHDEYQLITPDNDGNYTVSIRNYGALLLEFSDKPFTGNKYHPENPPHRNDFSYEKNPDFNYIPPKIDLQCAIMNFDIEFNHQSFGNQRFAPIRNLAGTTLRSMLKNQIRPIFDRAELCPDIYPAPMTYQAVFDLAYPEDAVLLFESSTILGQAQLFINNHLLNPGNFDHCNIYDAHNLSCNISPFVKKSGNLLTVKWSAAAEFDGLSSMFYVIRNESGR